MKKDVRARQMVSSIIAWLLTMSLMIGVLFYGITTLPSASAAGLPLTVGNVQFTINDFGVITNDIYWNMKSQTHIIYKSYLTIYHSAYPSGGGSTEVASGYGSGTGDFTVDEANIYVQSDTIQETYASFRQTEITGVSDDLKIYQTAFSKENEDWAILIWRIENIYGTDITDLRVGMNFRTRLGDTAGDDVDHWSPADSIYYIEDGGVGTTFMGISSADTTLPINHYYGAAAGKADAVDPTDEKSLYQALMTNKLYGSPAEITCMVGWELGTLPAGANITLPMIISFGTRYQDLILSAARAREFLILQSLDLVITEIQDYHSTENVKIEIYNDGEIPISTSDIYLSPNGFDVWNSGMWSKTTVAPKEYSVYSLGPGESFATMEGGRLSLHYQTGFKLDEVGFGQNGPAPDPLKDESIARFWNGINYSDEWVRDPSPTFGWINDRPGRLGQPTVVLNEVGFNMNQPEDRFIEIHYPGNVTVSLAGWSLVVDSEYLLPPITLNPVKRFFVLRGNDFPSTFGMDDGSLRGDNIYLYDNQGRLVDMVGWSSAHIKGQTMARVGDQAQWGYYGYDDSSSTENGWGFGSTPTPQIVDMGPDQSKTVDVGQTATYDVSVFYAGSGSDVLEITYLSSLGWNMSITDAFGNPLSDTDGDLVADTGRMVTGNSRNLRINVTAPLDPVSGNINTVYLTATSSVNPSIMVTLILRTTAVVPPYLVLNETADPETIWLEDSPLFPQESTITLTVTGAGTPLVWYMPQDTVFVLDNSGSMDWNDPMGLRFSGAKSYVDLMKVPDRAATVAFTTSAYLVNGHHLSWDYSLIKSDIDSIPPAGGGTDIASGIRVATDELIQFGDSNHVKVEILLTDGKNSNEASDAQTLSEAQRAADNGIIIFTIGLLAGGDVNEALLQQVADLTGGEYHQAPTADALKEIYLGIFQQIMNIAGKKVEDPTGSAPMIRNILPPYIHYVPGSFRDSLGSPLPPDAITVNPDGSTVLDWDVDKIFINQSWIVQFEVTSSRDGHVHASVYPDSRALYMKWDNSTISEPFPETFLTVLVPEVLDPPILGIDTDQSDIHLSWTIPGPNISYYLIYRSTDQRGFDFSNPFHSTQFDPDPTRPEWTDVGAASLNPKEYYYTVRAVNNLGIMSVTSNTVGKFTVSFEAGLNTFSLPLKPLDHHDIEWYANDIPNTEYIEWLDENDNWIRHWRGAPIKRVEDLEVGEGFQIYLSAPATYTFVGTPAAMIRYQEGLGSQLAYRRSLTAQAVQDKIILYWAGVTGAVGYNIYRAWDRMAFHTSILTPIATLGAGNTTWADFGAIANDSELYYMVVPIGESGREGSSTFAVGVVSITYKAGHNSIGIPLKPIGWWTLDYYCERILTATGMSYMVAGMWKFHATAMPAGVYDPFVEQAEGYQLSLDGLPSRFTYIGY